MPKVKTNRAAAKRFKKTKNGQYKRTKMGKRHILTKMSAKRKRKLRKAGLLSPSDRKVVMRMLPNG